MRLRRALGALAAPSPRRCVASAAAAASPRAAAAAAARGLLAEPPQHEHAGSSYASAASLSADVASAAASDCPWESYLLARGWLMRRRYAAAPPASRRAAVDALSTALSFPLTVAASWRHLVPAAAGRVRLCIVGARAEAALPVVFWRELALLTGVQHLALDFCGPAVAGSGVEAHRTWPLPAAAQPPATTVELTLEQPGDFFHHGAAGAALLQRRRGSPPPAGAADAYVLFNPGLGEPGWEHTWRPTLAALAAAERPLLLTALSASDAARDAAFLARDADAGSTPFAAGGGYAPNPWASTLAEDEVDDEPAAWSSRGKTDGGTRSNVLARVVRW